MSTKFQNETHLFNYIKKMLSVADISLDGVRFNNIKQTCSYLYQKYEQLNNYSKIFGDIYIKDFLKDFTYCISKIINEGNFVNIDFFVNKFVQQLQYYSNYVYFDIEESRMDIDFVNQHFLEKNDLRVIFGKEFSDAFIQDNDNYGVHQCGIYFLYNDCVLQDLSTQYCKEKVHTFAPEIFL